MFQLFVTPWTATHQASLFITNYPSLLKLMSIESVIPSNHLILCHPLLFPPSLFPASGSFQMSPFFTSGGQSIGVSEVSIHYVETAQLRLGLESPVFSLGSHTWSQDSMKLRFFVSCCRKNSLRDKMIGKKWIYLDISWSVCSPFQKVRTALGETHSIVKVWAISEDKRP